MTVSFVYPTDFPFFNASLDNCPYPCYNNRNM